MSGLGKVQGESSWYGDGEGVGGEVRRKLALLRKLAGTQWGAAETVLKNVYIGAIRHTLNMYQPHLRLHQNLHYTH